MAIALADERYYAIGWCVIFALNSGVRGGELRRARFGDFKLSEQPNFHVRRSISKTDSGERDVPLNPVALWAVSRLIERAEFLCGRKLLPQDYLLPQNLSRRQGPQDPERATVQGYKPDRDGVRRGGKYDSARPQRSWRKTWQNLCATAKAAWDKQHPEERFPDGLRFHDMRHSYISWSAETGIPLAVTMSVVGHLSTDQQLEYVHIQEGKKREAVEKVGAVLNFELPDLAQMHISGRVQ